MRLIDADELAERLWRFELGTREQVAGLVATMPTIEAEPIRHGHWIECLTSDHWKCSKCGDRAPIYWDGENMNYAEWLAPYCPNCGAKMDEEVQDDSI